MRMTPEERAERRRRRQLMREASPEYQARGMAAKAMREVQARMGAAVVAPTPLPSLPDCSGMKESLDLAALPVREKVAEVCRQIDLSTGPLMKVLTAAGLGTRYVECLKDVFEPESWKKLDEKEKKGYLGLVVKLLEISEGAKVTLKLESEAGATHEELASRKKALMNAWLGQLGRKHSAVS